MKKLKVDKASRAVKKFVTSLSSEQNGVDLELNGNVVCTVLPALQFSEEERATLVQMRRDLIRKVQERTKHIPAKVINKTIREAVETVRRRAS